MDGKHVIGTSDVVEIGVELDNAERGTVPPLRRSEASEEASTSIRMRFSDDEQDDEACGVFSSTRHEEASTSIRMVLRDDVGIDDIDYDPAPSTRQALSRYRHAHGYGATGTTPSRKSGSSDSSLAEEADTDTERTQLIISMVTAHPAPSTADNSSRINAWAKTAANIIAPTLPIVTIVVTGITSIITLSTDSASVQSASAITLSLFNVTIGFLAAVITLTYGYNKQTEQEKGAKGKLNAIKNTLDEDVNVYRTLELYCSQDNPTACAVSTCQSSITQHYKSQLGYRYIWATAGFSAASLLHPALAVFAFGAGFSNPILSFGLNLGASTAGTIVLALYSSVYRNWESRRIRLKNTSLENLSDILAINNKNCAVALLLASSHSPFYKNFIRIFDDGPTTDLLKGISEDSIRDALVAIRAQVVALADAIADRDETPARALIMQGLLCGMIENYATISEKIESSEVNMTGHTSTTTRSAGGGELRALAQAIRAKNNDGKLFGAEPEEIEQICATSDAVNARFGCIEKNVTTLTQTIERQGREIEHLKTANVELAAALKAAKAESAAALKAATESEVALKAAKAESAAALESTKAELMAVINSVLVRPIATTPETIGSYESIIPHTEARPSGTSEETDSTERPSLASSG